MLLLVIGVLGFVWCTEGFCLCLFFQSEIYEEGCWTAWQEKIVTANKIPG